MFTFEAYRDSMKAEWDRLAHTHGTVYHTTAFRAVLADSFGYRCEYYAVLDDRGAISALLPLVISRNLGLRKAAVSLPFINYLDICAASEDARQFAMNCAARLRDKLGLAYIELRLKEQVWSSPECRVNLQHHTFVLPLSEEEQVLALSSSSNRNHVRKVYKNDWFSVSFDRSHLDGFYSVYVKRMKQLGSPAPHIRFFRRFFELMPEHAHLLTVHDKASGQVVGGMLLVGSPSNDTLYYPYGANRSEFNHKYLNNFMYWEAVKFGIRAGFRFLDLGRSQTGSGTYKYKQQWGAVPQQLSYLVFDGDQPVAGPPDKEKLSMFIELWKVMPSAVTDPVGRVLIKYLLP